MRRLRLCVAAAALCALWSTGCGGGSSAPPEEELLFTYTLGDDGGVILPGIAWYAGALGVERAPGPGPYLEVFEDENLTPASQGAVIVQVEADDSEWSELVELLTNGYDDRMRVLLSRDTSPGTWQEKLESEYAFEVDRFGAPDLQGYFITRFELHVVELRFEVPGNDPNADGNWQQRFVEVRFEIHGKRVR